MTIKFKSDTQFSARQKSLKAPMFAAVEKKERLISNLSIIVIGFRLRHLDRPIIRHVRELLLRQSSSFEA